MEVKDNRYIRIWDYTNEEMMEFKLVVQTKKTHYIGGGVGAGGYYMKSEQVLSEGGDGIDTISTNSKLGAAINGKKLGNIVEYKTENGRIERFKIIGISCDGKKWEETDKEDSGEDVICDDSEHIYEQKRINKLGKTVLSSENSDERDTKELFEELRRLRSQISKEEHKPAYVIFQDKALWGMCDALPVNESQLICVNGVGEAKCQKYGYRFIEIIKRYVDSTDNDKSLPETNTITVKKCYSCAYSTKEDRYNFCPICGKRLDVTNMAIKKKRTMSV